MATATSGFAASTRRTAGKSVRISFLVNRPKEEPGFRLDRQEIAGRNVRYSTHAYVADRPEGQTLRLTPSRLRARGHQRAAHLDQNDAPCRSEACRRAAPAGPTIRLRAEFEGARVEEVLSTLERELVGLTPVKTRIREIASLLVIERARRKLALTSDTPTLHMSFTGNPGTGKTTVALRMADLLHRLGFVRRGHLVSVTRDDLVGQYIGHTAPKTKEILKKAMGGVLFIDEAYYLYRPENERDYGQESIEILLQVMENTARRSRGHPRRLRRSDGAFLREQSGLPLPHRPSHRLSRLHRGRAFADRGADASRGINFKFSPAAREAFVAYIAARMKQPLFSNARSIRNALDRARLRQANRLMGDLDRDLTADDLMTIEPPDITASRVFKIAEEQARRHGHG